MKYGVTIHLVQNLPLTSNHKFRFGLAWPGQGRQGQNGTLSQREVLHKVNGNPVENMQKLLTQNERNKIFLK